MTKTDTLIKTQTIPSEIYINGKKIHGGLLPIKYYQTNNNPWYQPPYEGEGVRFCSRGNGVRFGRRGGNGVRFPIGKGGSGLTNQGFLEGCPLGSIYTSVGQGMEEESGDGILGDMFGWIPVVGDLVKKTGLGMEGEEIHGGFPWLAAIPAVLSGIDLIKGLFKGNGMEEEAKICEQPGEECVIEFKDKGGQLLFKNKDKLNGMHKALLADHPFLEEISSSLDKNMSGEGVYGTMINGPLSSQGSYGGKLPMMRGGNVAGLENINKV